MSEFIDSLPSNFEYEIEIVSTVIMEHRLRLDATELEALEKAGVNIFDEFAIAKYASRKGLIDFNDWDSAEFDHVEPQGTYCKEGREMICNGLDEYEPEESSG